MGRAHTCVLGTLDEGGVVYCQGENLVGQLGTTADTEGWALVLLGGSVESISARGDTTCAIVSGGALYCWGDDSRGEITGVPSSHVSTPFASMEALFTQVRVGDGTTCAITSSGTVRCWGANEAGQAGQPVSASAGRGIDVGTRREDGSIAPVLLENGDVVLGDRFACAWDVDPATLEATVWCWGDSSNERYGRPVADDAHIVTRATTGEPVTSISATFTHTIATRPYPNGPMGRGDNSSGQIAAPDVGTYVNWYVTRGPDEVDQALAANGYTCINVRGAVQCRGANDLGQLGTGTLESRNGFVDVVGLEGTTSLFANTQGRTCALTESNNVLCWGAGMGPTPMLMPLPQVPMD